MVTMLTASVEESRTTWLLFALIALAARLSAEHPEAVAVCFPATHPQPSLEIASASLL
jgi:hypothetical protein